MSARQPPGVTLVLSGAVVMQQHVSAKCVRPGPFPGASTARIKALEARKGKPAGKQVEENKMEGREMMEFLESWGSSGAGAGLL